MLRVGPQVSAVGGHPRLDSPKLLPRYPGPLPGTIDDGLVVGLAPFSVALVRDVFMRIEQPEHALGFGTPEPAYGDALTIGQFYRRIRATLVALGEGAFTGRAHYYRLGSPAALACAAFNRTYAGLLKSLQAAFSGSPGELTPAVTVMMSLRQQAVGMLSGSATGGVPAGPSFEWPDS